MLLGVSWKRLFGSLGDLLGHPGVSQEPLGEFLALLGPPGEPLGASSRAPVVPKGAPWAFLGASWGFLRSLRARASPSHLKGSVE